MIARENTSQSDALINDGFIKLVLIITNSQNVRTDTNIQSYQNHFFITENIDYAHLLVFF